VFAGPSYRDKKVVGVFVRFSCAASVAATCGMFDIPIEGIALILPIDHFAICLEVQRMF
jgi:hypothetical protein